MARQRVMLQNLLHPKSQSGEATPHVGMSGCQPDLDARVHRKEVHRSASRPLMIRSSASTSTSRSTITCRPLAVTTSIRPEPREGGCAGAVGTEGSKGAQGSGTTSAGTNPSHDPAPSRPSL